MNGIRPEFLHVDQARVTLRIDRKPAVCAHCGNARAFYAFSERHPVSGYEMKRQQAVISRRQAAFVPGS
jgi:hypothetical protein